MPHGTDQEGLDSSTLPPFSELDEGLPSPQANLGLAVAWARDEPGLIANVVLVPAEGVGLWGRGKGARTGVPRLTLVQWSPSGISEPTHLSCRHISRDQLRLTARADKTLLVENIGACPLTYAGQPVHRAELQVGDTISLGKELLLLCVRRPKQRPSKISELLLPEHRFGLADAFGLVGESPAIWELRERLMAIASQLPHVLILGASGTGKELVAQAIHSHSARCGRPMVSRNAATIPESIADAELFGNARGYPNPGMPERSGLIGAAHESTLFLDEIGELPLPLQAHLLRVLDNGEYQRLGESRARIADFRLIGATNRPVRDLKHDLIARLTLRLVMPDLNARREDIPLLIRHLLQRYAVRDPKALVRFLPSDRPHAFPHVSQALVESLLKHEYRTNVRELEGYLMEAVLRSSGTRLELESNVLAPKPRVEVPRQVVEPRSCLARESWLSTEDAARLALLRRHRFSPTSCGRDPAYPGNRQTADLHFRHLVCKALARSGWEVGPAAALLVGGGGDLVLVEKCASRIETFLSNLETRIACEPAAHLERALTDDWKSLVGAVLPLVEMLRTKRSPLSCSPLPRGA